jgi:hypothetical protein
MCFHPIISKLVIGCGVSILSWLFKWNFGEVLEKGNIFGCCSNAKRLFVSRKVDFFLFVNRSCIEFLMIWKIVAHCFFLSLQLLQLVAIEDGIINSGQTPKMMKVRNFQWDSVQ